MQSHHHGLKLVILGRDGILNVFRTDHVKAPHEWIPIEGALEAVARLNQAGWHAVLATNQSGIGRGYFTEDQYAAVHARSSPTSIVSLANGEFPAAPALHFIIVDVRDVAKAHAMARKVKSGVVWINCFNEFDDAAPFGGYKASGIGREKGHHNLDAYLETKSVFGFAAA